MDILRSGYVTGYAVDKVTKGKPCEACVKGKQQRLPFRHEGKRASQVLQLLHSDLCGPMETRSIGGSRYIFTIIDDHSRKVFVYFLEHKSQVMKTFESFKQLVENQTEAKIKILRTDNGKEYINNKLKNFLQESGIRHQTIVAYTPEQNGTAERMNRTIVEKARSMLLDAGLPTNFWAEAVSTAVYLINRSPAAALPNITPEEVWSGSKPDISHLKIFGCKAMLHVPRQERRKWDSKSTDCIFLGYYEDSKAYRLMQLDSRKFVKGRDVIFFKTQKTFAQRISQNAQTSSQPTGSLELQEEEERNDEKERDDNGNRDQDDEEEESELEISMSGESSSRNDSSYDTIIEGDRSSDYEPSENQSDAAEDYQKDGHIRQEEVGPRRSQRAPVSRRMNEYVTYLISEGYTTDPTSVQEAMQDPDSKYWEEAMQSEFDSLQRNETWILVDLPSNKKLIDTKWVFKRKRSGNGVVERYKARLVVKGFLQKFGEEYTETYAPVARTSSIRYLFALVVKYDWDIEYLDIETAF